MNRRIFIQNVAGALAGVALTPLTVVAQAPKVEKFMMFSLTGKHPFYGYLLGRWVETLDQAKEDILKDYPDTTEIRVHLDVKGKLMEPKLLWKKYPVV